MYEDHQVAKSGKEGGHMVTNYSDNIFGSASSSPTGTVQNPNFKRSTFLNPNFSYVIPVCFLFLNPNFSNFIIFCILKSLSLILGFFLEGRVWDDEHD